MSKVSTPHTTWCSQDDCYTRQDGQTVHRSAGESFVDEGMATVRLVDRGNGIEVALAVDGRIVSTEIVLIPEMAAELGEALIDHAERAQGFGSAPANPSSEGSNATTLHADHPVDREEHIAACGHRIFRDHPTNAELRRCERCGAWVTG
ncbi:MAG: hypothetical protein ACRDS1_16845 [Pseudonocardiaceae bacterium]